MHRILVIQNINDARKELNKIGVSSQGIEVMAPKSMSNSIKLTNVKVGAANILKQEMLSIGGDAAVSRGVVEGSVKKSDVILLGNFDKIKKLVNKLNYQNIFGLPEIRTYLQQELDNHLNNKTNKLDCGGYNLFLDKLHIIGILNITPDSFSDGNKFFDLDKALEHAKKMIEEGADIIDIGGESTRPGAKKVDISTEIERVLPVVKEIRKMSDIPISIDTTKAKVAKKAIENGANIINDISALRFDNKMVEILKKYRNIPVILMHMQGSPADMQNNPCYDDTIDEILSFLSKRIDFCLQNGINKDRIIIDPGIGFGKRHKDNLIILKKLQEFKSLQVPVLLGASRKSFINRIYTSSVTERLEGSLATTSIAFNHNIEFIRVHDVRKHYKFIKTLSAIRNN